MEELPRKVRQEFVDELKVKFLRMVECGSQAPHPNKHLPTSPTPECHLPKQCQELDASERRLSPLEVGHCTLQA